MKWLFALPILTGCFLSRPPVIGEDQGVGLAVPVTKQKQKIVLLQKKLEIAEKGQRKAQDEVERLGLEVHRAQLAMIQRQVESYEQQLRSWRENPQKYAQLFQIESSTLFLKERETLHQLIQTGPSPSAFEAQVVLDRILRMITELSDNEAR